MRYALLKCIDKRECVEPLRPRPMRVQQRHYTVKKQRGELFSGLVFLKRFYVNVRRRVKGGKRQSKTFSGRFLTSRKINYRTHLSLHSAMSMHPGQCRKDLRHFYYQGRVMGPRGNDPKAVGFYIVLFRRKQKYKLTALG